MNSTLLVPPTSHDIPGLQRPSDDITRSKIKYAMKMERFFFQKMRGGGRNRENISALNILATYSKWQVKDKACAQESV